MTARDARADVPVRQRQGGSGAAAVVRGAADEAERGADGEGVVADEGGVERARGDKLRVGDDDGAPVRRLRLQSHGAAPADRAGGPRLHVGGAAATECANAGGDADYRMHAARAPDPRRACAGLQEHEGA